MGKFGFPSRKKGNSVQAPAVEDPPMSKAHKILGSTPLSIDGPPKNWDKSLAPHLGIPDGLVESQGLGLSPYFDTDALPRDRLRGIAASDERSSHDTDSLDPLRAKLAAVNPWYDKFMAPPGALQHPSNSGIGQGLPSKAERLLDISGTGSISKKKPTRLDFSTTKRSAESRSDMSTSPHSIMSPHSASTKSNRNRLQKRGTKESLASPTSDTFHDDKARRHGSGMHSDSAPDLYRHYEQMSYRQVMDGDLEPSSAQADPATYDDSDYCSEEGAQDFAQHKDDEGTLQERPFIVDPSHLRHYSQATLIAKTEVVEPDDKSDSVSSRHTRTSKMTDKSSQDFHEKSVLMLSSDSEGEEDDPGVPRPVSHHPQTAQALSGQSVSMDHGLHTIPEFPTFQGDAQALGFDRTASKASRQSKRSTWTSYAPFPSQRGTMSPMSSNTPTAATFETANENLSFSRASSRFSGTVISPSPVPSRTWNEPGGLGVPTPRPIPTSEEEQGDIDEEEEEDGSVFQPPSLADLGLGDVDEMEDEEETTQAGPVAQVVVNGQSTNQPTPPLSPSSATAAFPPQRRPMAQEGGNEGQSRYMSVTPEEEMLLAALRQKRQQMQDNNALAQSMRQMGLAQAQYQPARQRSPQTTNSQPGFDFDFPTPPKSNQSDEAPRRATSVQHRVLPLPGVDEEEVLGQSRDFPRPHTHQHPAAHQTERILLCMNKPFPHNAEHGEPEPSPDVSDLEYGTAVTTPDIPSEQVQELQVQPWPGIQGVSQRPPAPPVDFRRPRPHARDSIRHGNHRASRKKSDAGVPRPDSPVNAFPPIPSGRPMLNKEMARLSAVGPPAVDSQLWHDED